MSCRKGTVCSLKCGITMKASKNIIWASSPSFPRKSTMPIRTSRTSGQKMTTPRNSRNRLARVCWVGVSVMLEKSTVLTRVSVKVRQDSMNWEWEQNSRKQRERHLLKLRWGERSVPQVGVWHRREGASLRFRGESSKVFLVSGMNLPKPLNLRQKRWDPILGVETLR